MVVDTRTLKGTELILGFEISVVGEAGRQNNNIVWLPELEEDFAGYRIIASEQFGKTVRVEIDAFVLEEVV
jgi:hypothetical protein